MRPLGVLKFGDKFHLSLKKLAELKPWHIIVPGRDVCLCHDHLEFSYFRAAHRRWSLAAKKSMEDRGLSPCGCVSVNTDAELRHHLLCEKIPWGQHEMYDLKCCKRMCAECSPSVDKLSCEACRAEKPSLNFMSYDKVQYIRLTLTHSP